MSFRKLSDQRITCFNSFNSMDMLDTLMSHIEKSMSEERAILPSRTIAPSSFRCARMEWFRLRGTQPDKRNVDYALEFRAKIGDACHLFLQSYISTQPGVEWISVEDWLKNNTEHTFEVTRSGFEYKIEFKDVPIQFSVDGLIRWNNKVYLVEIKSVEDGTLQKMVTYRERDVDQIDMYGTLLHVHDALIFYISRLDGSIKVYEYAITDDNMKSVQLRIDEILEYAKVPVAPEGLSKSNPMCSSSYCKYYNTCKDWGR